jgi:hypothetical protein
MLGDRLRYERFMLRPLAAELRTAAATSHQPIAAARCAIVDFGLLGFMLERFAVFYLRSQHKLAA